MTAFPGALPHARGAPGPSRDRGRRARGADRGLPAQAGGLRGRVHEASSRLGDALDAPRGLHGRPAQRARRGVHRHGAPGVPRLIKELGLALVNLLAAEQAGTEPLHYFDGQPYTDAQATQDYREVGRRSARRERRRLSDHLPLLDGARPRTGPDLGPGVHRAGVPGGRGSRFGQLLDVAYVTEYGAEAGDQRSLNLLYLLGFSSPQFEIFGESDELFRVQGGNAGSCERLVAALSADHARVGADRDSIVARAAATTLRGGARLRSVGADRAILALPFSMLRVLVDISGAGFKPRKRTAIQQRMGANASCTSSSASVAGRTLGCNGETFADTGYQSTLGREPRPGRQGRHPPQLHRRGGGGRPRRGPPSAGRRFRPPIDSVMPGIRPLCHGRAALDHWPSNPQTKGSYSFWKVGRTRASPASRARSRTMPLRRRAHLARLPGLPQRRRAVGRARGGGGGVALGG